MSTPIPTEILRAYLIEEDEVSHPYDLSSGAVWPCYLSALPEQQGEPADAIALFDTTPRQEQRDMDGGLLVVPRLQVRVRSQTYVDGFNKAIALHNAMLKAPGKMVTVADPSQESPYVAPQCSVQNIRIVTAPLFIGVDTGTRRTYSFTISVELLYRDK